MVEILVQEKICSKCKKSKPLELFNKKKQYYLGVDRLCQKCRREYINSWRNKNRDKMRQYEKNSAERIKNYNLNWRKNNKEYLSKYYKEWAMNNPDKVKIKAKKSYLKRKEDPKDRIRLNISVAIRRSLKSKSKGNKNWENLLGYTSQRLKIHLEKQFKNGMSWKNYGKYWHIDHKIPISAFNFKDISHIDFKKCWALSNLQPLESIKNIIKSNKLDKPFQPSLLL
jgi:hypothetical protein